MVLISAGLIPSEANDDTMQQDCGERVSAAFFSDRGRRYLHSIAIARGPQRTGT